MSVVAPLAAVLRLSTKRMQQRAALVGALTLVERVLAPVVAYVVVFQGPARGLVGGVTLGVVFTARAVAQRTFVGRNEVDLYRRSVRAVLSGDVLQPRILPDEEARVSLFQGLHRIARLLAEAVPNLVANVVAALLVSTALAALEPLRISMAAAAALVVGVGASYAMRRLADYAESASWKAWGVVAEAITDACEGRLDLVAAGCADAFLRSFDRFADVWRQKDEGAARTGAVLGRLPIVIVGLALATMLAADLAVGRSSWNALALQAGLLVTVAPSFLGVARSLQELSGNQHRLNLALRIIGSSPTPPASKLQVATPSPQVVEWLQLEFKYAHGEQLALRRVSFAWRAGELLALAGPNGSGKSTCLRAALGLGDFAFGDVFVDGIALRTIDLPAWRQSVAFLPQQPYLPARLSVRDCLRFIDPTISDETMLASLERVGMLSRLRLRTSDPLASPVGSLSMGERQRIALARMLCRPAKVVMLDEPDANLDRDGIKLVADLISELARDRMVLVVAHTAEVLAAADRVITLEGGTVKADTVRRSGAAIG